MRQTVRFLKNAQEKYDHDFKAYLRVRSQNSRLLERLSDKKLQQMSKEEALTVLIDGGKLLANLTKHWNGMTVFFDTIETAIDASFSDEILTIAGITKSAVKQATSLEMKAENLKFLGDSFGVVRHAAACLSQIASTYVKFSARFIVSDMNALPQLLESDSDAIREVRQKR